MPANRFSSPRATYHSEESALMDRNFGRTTRVLGPPEKSSGRTKNFIGRVPMRQDDRKRNEKKSIRTKQTANKKAPSWALFNQALLLTCVIYYDVTLNRNAELTLRPSP
jgi:hypothetical protein